MDALKGPVGEGIVLGELTEARNPNQIEKFGDHAGL